MSRPKNSIVAKNSQSPGSAPAQSDAAIASKESQQRLVFLCGSARSGTTALARLVNLHAKVFIGVERYYRLAKARELQPRHFELDRFCSMRDSDTHESAQRQMPNAEMTRKRYAHAEVVGDKLPFLFEMYDYVLETFPDAQIIYIVRNPIAVCESYQARLKNPDDHWSKDFRVAVDEWNASIRATLDLALETDRISVVTYERLFTSRDRAQTLAARLDLDPSTFRWRDVDALLERAKAVATKTIETNDALRAHVSLNADFDTYRTLVREHCIFSPRPSTAAAKAG